MTEHLEVPPSELGDDCHVRAGAGEIPLLSLWSERRLGAGEDARPLTREVTPGRGLVAVFDGLGGSGAASVEAPDGPVTQARLAAQTARAWVDSHARDVLDRRQEPVRLAADLASVLRRTADEHGLGPGRLRSRMIRTLPTTVAIGTFACDAGEIRCDALWAGDSRIYLMTPYLGLQQLSVDHLRSGADPLANLVEDSPLSNVASASGEFRLQRTTVRIEPIPAVLVAATDGCFGYLPTPMHFEHLLLEPLWRAMTFHDWVTDVRRRIEEVAGDDATIAMAVLRPGLGLDELRGVFAGRFAHVDGIVTELDEVRDSLLTARTTLAVRENAWRAARERCWLRYREHYELGRRDPQDGSYGGR